MTIKHQTISVIPGDGIGQEVTPAALAVLEAVGSRHGLQFDYRTHDWSCARFLEHGSMMPADGLETLRETDAILLGAVGAPGVADHVSLWGLLIPIRRAFQLYVNYRPVRTFEGLTGPLRDGGPLDLVVVRENTEGEYSDVGGRAFQGEDREFATQQAVFTRVGTERIIDWAFDLAVQRGGSVTSATKSNGILHTMTFWDEIVRECAERYPTVGFSEEHIDALCAKLVLNPSRFDVIVGSNLFGDIVSDLIAALAGSIGIAPSANIDPTGTYPAMFEPVHGSAPDIAGKGIANPLGAIWSVSLMLDHLGHEAAAKDVMEAISHALASGVTLTPDLGGSCHTEEMTAAIIGALPSAASSE